MDFIAPVITWLSANIPVAAALVTALISAVVALLALFANPFFSARIERLKSELSKTLEVHKLEIQHELEVRRSLLADQNSERNAKRDYEYEARKRLYSEVEPLMFALREAAEGARVRVESLARTSRDGHLGTSGWLSTQGYYFRSTVYRLFLPAAILRLLQRKMTLVDMALDPGYGRKYSLLKVYGALFSDDYGIAAMEPAIPYSPPESEGEKALHPKQGLYAGNFESAVDMMLVQDGELLRPATFGEFDIRWNESSGSSALRHVPDLIMHFAPDTSPVLARMVHLVGCVSYLLERSFDTDPSKSSFEAITGFLESDGYLKKFAWEAVPMTPGRSVISYLKQRLTI